jgi:hypothetical protein
MLEHGDRRYEIFAFPSQEKLDQAKFGKLADLSKTKNYPISAFPYDKLATIWWGLKQENITKRYHVESATMDSDKQNIYDMGVSPVQAWLLTELPDVFSKDFVVWFLANFYPQRDKLKPIEETEYFFSECKSHIQSVRNNKGAISQRLSLTKLQRVTASDGRLMDMQHRPVPRGSNYYQYLYTVRNHGNYDDRTADSYYILEDEVIKFYKSRVGPLSNTTEEDLHKILTKFIMRTV